LTYEFYFGAIFFLNPNIHITRKTMYIYIDKDGNPSTKSTRHVKANVYS
jgi:hypothetical protein